jgi:hypothetical protein
VNYSVKWTLQQGMLGLPSAVGKRIAHYWTAGQDESDFRSLR